jgi:DNA-binding LytR/AlgR family response regulator
MQEYIFVKKNRQFIRIKIADLIFIKALREHMQFVTESQVYFVHNTMDAIEEKIPRELFCRVHRSYMVAINRILGFTETELYLTQPPAGTNYKGLAAAVTTIPLGKSYRRNLREALLIIPNRANKFVFRILAKAEEQHIHALKNSVYVS